MRRAIQAMFGQQLQRSAVHGLTDKCPEAGAGAMDAAGSGMRAEQILRRRAATNIARTHSQDPLEHRCETLPTGRRCKDSWQLAVETTKPAAENACGAAPCVPLYGCAKLRSVEPSQAPTTSFRAQLETNSPAYRRATMMGVARVCRQEFWTAAGKLEASQRSPCVYSNYASRSTTCCTQASSKYRPNASWSWFHLCRTTCAGSSQRLAGLSDIAFAADG
jgi:hypothetical protein